MAFTWPARSRSAELGRDADESVEKALQRLHERAAIIGPEPLGEKSPPAVPEPPPRPRRDPGLGPMIAELERQIEADYDELVEELVTWLAEELDAETT
jgi:hypothetical protein